MGEMSKDHRLSQECGAVPARVRTIWPWRWHAMALAALLGSLLTTGAPAVASECPPALKSATRLIMVVTSGFDGPTARLVTYERAKPDEGWVRQSAPIAATVGRSGLAWGWTAGDLAKQGEPIKVEGDKRTPAGVFAMGRPFGTPTSSLPGYLQLKPGETYCVDDARSSSYGRIVAKRTLEVGTSGEDMATIPLYKRGVVVDYPPNASRKAGSCIFLHIWRRPGAATVGCVAAGEAEITALQNFSAAGPTAIAILPEAALARLGRCLPAQR